MPPWLTDAEIADICAPLVMPAAQRRYLTRLGLIVKTKPNGRPLVARGEFERVMIGHAPGQAVPAHNATAGAGSAQPDRAALLQLFQGGKARGPQAQGR